jgi:hypothetical protein
MKAKALQMIVKKKNNLLVNLLTKATKFKRLKRKKILYKKETLCEKIFIIIIKSLMIRITG